MIIGSIKRPKREVRVTSESYSIIWWLTKMEPIDLYFLFCRIVLTVVYDFAMIFRLSQTLAATIHYSLPPIASRFELREGDSARIEIAISEWRGVKSPLPATYFMSARMFFKSHDSIPNVLLKPRGTKTLLTSAHFTLRSG